MTDDEKKPLPTWYHPVDWLTATVDLGPRWGTAYLEDPPEACVSRWLKNAVSGLGRDQNDLVKELAGDLSWTALHLAPFVVRIEGGTETVEITPHDEERWLKETLLALPHKIVGRLVEAVTIFHNASDDQPEGNA